MKCDLPNSHENTNEIKFIENKLYDAEPYIKEALKNSFEKISEVPTCENDLVMLWAVYLKNLSDYFYEISEQSNNKKIYKKVIKYLMFNK